jgi:hypothetical protein
MSAEKGIGHWEIIKDDLFDGCIWFFFQKMNLRPPKNPPAADRSAGVCFFGPDPLAKSRKEGPV